MRNVALWMRQCLTKGEVKHRKLKQAKVWLLRFHVSLSCMKCPTIGDIQSVRDMKIRLSGVPLDAPMLPR